MHQGPSIPHCLNIISFIWWHITTCHDIFKPIRIGNWGNLEPLSLWYGTLSLFLLMSHALRGPHYLCIIKVCTQLPGACIDSVTSFSPHVNTAACYSLWVAAHHLQNSLALRETTWDQGCFPCLSLDSTENFMQIGYHNLALRINLALIWFLASVAMKRLQRGFSILKHMQYRRYVPQKILLQEKHPRCGITRHITVFPNSPNTFYFKNQLF